MSKYHIRIVAGVLTKYCELKDDCSLIETQKIGFYYNWIGKLFYERLRDVKEQASYFR